MGLAATRFATSKLKTCDDFDTLSSFGFRGEALASMSLVSKLEIVSRISSGGNRTAFCQSYRNGKPTLANPKPQARTVGTTVTVSDLFYNMPHRKASLLKSEEYQKVLQVVQCYAIHYPLVAFVCSKNVTKRGKVVDLHTGTTTTTLQEENVDAARQRILASIFTEQKMHFLKEQEQHDHYTLNGLVSDPSGSLKKTQFALFCNHRWVESNELKRLLESLYKEFLINTGNSKPLLYISIHVNPKEVDVNVHPSKKQVTLLHQDEIYKSIVASVRKVLEGVGRTIAAVPLSQKRKRQDATKQQQQQQQRPQSGSKDKIRTTKAAPAGAIEPFVISNKSSSSNSSSTIEITHESSCSLANIDMANPGAFAQRCTCANIVRTQRTAHPQKVPKIVPTVCTYKSVKSLRNRILKYADESWKQRSKEAIFVGKVSDQRCLVQCGVELQEWHLEGLAQLLFQQLALQQFGGLPVATMVASVDISKVVGQFLELEDLLASENEDDNEEFWILDQDLLLTVRETHQSLANQVAMCLLDRAEMLEEYFSVGIDKEKDGTIVLTTLPIILPNHQPQLAGLSLFFLRLATEVAWDEEKPCFFQIAKELGLYYGVSACGEMQHQIFPAICQLLIPPKNSECFRTLTQLSNLYKGFER